MSEEDITEILKTVDARELAYAIFSIIAGYPNKIYLIVGDKEKKDKFMTLLSYIFEDLYGDPRIGWDDVNASFEVIDSQEYQKEWKKFVNFALAYIDEDKNIKSQFIEGLISIIGKVLKKTFPPPEDKLKEAIYKSLVVLNIIQTKEKTEGRELSAEELENILKSYIVYNEQKDIIMELLDYSKRKAA